MSKRLSLKQIELLKKHQFILKRLAKSSSKDRTTILKNAPSELFQTLSLVLRILSDQNLKISKKHERNIKKHKSFLKNATDLKQTAIKRKLRNQRGGFLPAILSAALPIIGSIIGSIL